MKLRADIKRQAKDRFMRQYGVFVGACVLYVLFSSIAGTITMGLGFFFFMPPLIVGYAYFSLRVYHGEKVDIADMFSGFSDYWRNVGGILFMYVFIFLWSLLFIIPGIIKSLAYFMAPYILAESKSVPSDQAIKLSMRMTQGYKGEIFVMALSFIGWGILTAMTFGLLGILYTGPYISTSFAGLYDELKQNALQKGIVTAAELA